MAESRKKNSLFMASLVLVSPCDLDSVDRGGTDAYRLLLARIGSHSCDWDIPMYCGLVCDREGDLVL